MKFHFYIACFVIINFSKNSYSQLIKHYLGCYEDFYQNVIRKDKSSVTSCIEECKTDRQITFAALKNGSECHCGNHFRISTQESSCRKMCKDSRIEFCGGEQHYSVYSICVIGLHGQHCEKPCTYCQNSVPCMRSNGECYLSKCRKGSRDKCDIARFLNGVNVAFNRPAHQSSTYRDDQGRTYPASFAVDGNNNTNVDAGRSCSHTNNDENPWFYVDLEVERVIKKVIITNREDIANAQRLYHARIYLSNVDPPTDERDRHLCGTVTRLQNIEITCTSSNKYRFLVVTLTKTEFLSICEIEAYMDECMKCESNEVCTNVIGNTDGRCTCKSGFYKDNIYSPCSDVNECLNNPNKCDKNSTSCNITDGSYHCECKTGYHNLQSRYQNLMACIDVDECRTNKHQCDLRSTSCSNNIGSYVCNCKTGYRQESSIKCNDIDECRTSHSCDTTTSSCVNNVGSYTCSCKEGYVNYENNIRCVDYDECRNNKHRCNTTSTICLNTDGSYYCQCKSGYQNDRNDPYKCKDIDECKDTSTCDSRTSTCRNTDGSYVCDCHIGYQRQYSYPSRCVDIDECTQNKCDTLSTTCENMVGSFKCNCKHGFKPFNHTSCSDVDKCLGNYHNCDLSTTTCKNFKGNFLCDCKVGFEKISSNNNSCKDIDECSRNICDKKSTNCQNNHGSYLCHCKDGYERLNEFKCSDIDECSRNTHDCDKQTTTCKNIDGGYKCHCLGGYENITGNNKSCRDIDECTNNPQSCNRTISTCYNSGGSYKCKCKEGFVNVGNEIRCIDVDECKNNKHECDITTNICLNTDGSYICKCKSGYQQNNTSHKCTDVDECLFTENYDSIVQCINTEGSFKMSCPQGFNLLEEGGRSTCKDVDECLQPVFDSNVRCINLEGDFVLSCPIKMYLDEIDGKYECKVTSNAGKIAAGFMSVVVLILGILLIFQWKRMKCRKHAEHHPQNDLFLVCAGKEVGQKGNYNLNPKYGESKLSTDLNEYLKLNPEKECRFQNQFRELVGRSFEEIRDSLSSKEITTKSDKWKVYSADGVNIPNKYIFASFPSESDVDKFWELSIKHSNVVVLIDHAKDSELPFLPSNTKTFKNKEFFLKLIKTENKGFLEVKSISASFEEDFYENMDGTKPQQSKPGEFVVILVHLKNKDFLTKEFFLEIKNETDLVSYSNSLDGRASSIFVLSRDDIKMASFYVACCKLFDQMAPYQEDEYAKLIEIVN